jgi:hypothetical protein
MDRSPAQGQSLSMTTLPEKTSSYPSLIDSVKAAAANATAKDAYYEKMLNECQ